MTIRWGSLGGSKVTGCGSTEHFPHDWDLDSEICEKCKDQFCQVKCRTCGATDRECKG